MLQVLAAMTMQKRLITQTMATTDSATIFERVPLVSSLRNAARQNTKAVCQKFASSRGSVRCCLSCWVRGIGIEKFRRHDEIHAGVQSAEISVALGIQCDLVGAGTFCCVRRHAFVRHAAVGKAIGEGIETRSDKSNWNKMTGIKTGIIHQVHK